MKDEIREQLTEAGIDVDGAVQRCAGMEEFYLRLLKRFVDDGYLAKYQEALESGDRQHAKEELHTMKGVAANLGLVPLERECQIGVDALKAGEPVPNQAEIEAAYEKMSDMIQLV